MHGAAVNGVSGADRGNLATLTKVDKLREFIGSRISLPQLVVVGDQSSGKSSVLEGITGFAFPRDAELCTRYATQITCRREEHVGVTVSIMPHADADTEEKERIRCFQRSFHKMTNEDLCKVFKEANAAMGLRASKADEGDQGFESTGKNAFSEHILKIEICGPEREHFTVIDVPGIFRRETEGVTTESDIQLVRNMVMKYMKDSRTIILAIMPANVDPATQEILKLANQVDPGMTRTMGVLTKADLAIESAMQRIAIDLVTGKRRDLTLGYYIVKNRGPDEADLTLDEGQQKEMAEFSKAHWSLLRGTGRFGITALQKQVRTLLVGLIKQEFPHLRAEVVKELSTLNAELSAMGLDRSSAHAQRAYVGGVCEAFQSITRDALGANYTGHTVFDDEDNLRLITRVMELNDQFTEGISRHGYTRSFSLADGGGSDAELQTLDANTGKQPEISATKWADPENYPELGHVQGLDFNELEVDHEQGDIMDYIENVYKNSRGVDLGTFSGSLLATVFREQTKNWEPITMAYISNAILLVHHFIVQVLNRVCPDEQVREELWNNHLLDRLLESYRRAVDHARFLLSVERDSWPLTMNHYFNANLQKTQGERLVSKLKNLQVMISSKKGESESSSDDFGGYFNWSTLANLSVNQGNAEHARVYIHDVLHSYYKVSWKRFVDVVCQQAVFHHLLRAEEGPLRIFNSKLVHSLEDDQLDAIAGESAAAKAQRERLHRDVKNFEEALKVLKGSSS